MKKLRPRRHVSQYFGTARWRRTVVLSRFTLVLALLSGKDERNLQCGRRGPFPIRVRVLVQVRPWLFICGQVCSVGVICAWIVPIPGIPRKCGITTPPL